MLAFLGNIIAWFIEQAFLRWTRPRLVSQLQAEEESKPDTPWNVTVKRL